MTSDLFSSAGLNKILPIPLAERLRPTQLSDVIGQEHLLGPKGALSHLLCSQPASEARGLALGSLIFWGPPGTGKTTVAHMLPQEAARITPIPLIFESLSALRSGVHDLREAFERARGRRSIGQQTLLFVDEIHRFNRAQLDAFLPVMEDGTLILIGATTENPSFALSAPLLSRARVMVFHALTEKAMDCLLTRAEKEEGRSLPLTSEAREALIRMADGDGRALFTLAEDVWLAAHDTTLLSQEDLKQLIQQRAPIYDKAKDSHYNLISALHKSVRGSDPDAALYYLARMLLAGEDRLFLARRSRAYGDGRYWSC